MEDWLALTVAPFKARAAPPELPLRAYVANKLVRLLNGCTKPTALRLVSAAPCFTTIAREADPSAKLFYNDFNEWVPAKREAIYTLVKKLKDQGLIDGIGLQQHVGLTSPTTALLETAISRYAELGLEIHITELDVEVNPTGNYTELTPDLAIALSNRYKELFTVYAKYPGSITAVMNWNVIDSSSWLLAFPTAHTTWPLLFDADGKPKLAFWNLTN